MTLESLQRSEGLEESSSRREGRGEDARCFVRLFVLSRKHDRGHRLVIMPRTVSDKLCRRTDDLEQ